VSQSDTCRISFVPQRGMLSVLRQLRARFSRANLREREAYAVDQANGSEIYQEHLGFSSRKTSFFKKVTFRVRIQVSRLSFSRTSQGDLTSRELPAAPMAKARSPVLHAACLHSRPSSYLRRLCTLPTVSPILYTNLMARPSGTKSVCSHT
jgi:hypothetical protein